MIVKKLAALDKDAPEIDTWHFECWFKKKGYFLVQSEAGGSQTVESQAASFPSADVTAVIELWALFSFKWHAGLK